MNAFNPRAAAIVLSLLLVGTAHAQTRYEWTGGNGGWDDPSRWSPAGIPTAADTAALLGSGVVTLAANTTVAGLEMKLGSAVAGDFDLTLTDLFVWDGGGGEGFRGTGTVTVAVGATLSMVNPTSGSDQFVLGAGRTLVNDGTILWESDGRWGGQGRLVNNGEMRLVMGQSNASGFIFSNLPDAITNTASGVIRRDGTGAALLSSGFVNDGLIRVETGTLQLGGFNSNGGRGTGSIEIDAGAQLLVSGGTHIQGRVTGSSLTVGNGSGRRLEINDAFEVTTTRVTAGLLQLDADGETGTLQIEGGEVGGSGNLTVTVSLDWSGGGMGGSGTTTLGPAIPLTIGGDVTIRLDDTRTLRTEGPTTWTGDADLSAGTSTTTFENAGTFISSGPGERRTDFVTFRNTGTLVHDGGTLRFAGAMTNEGEMRVEAGTLRLNSTGTDTGRYTVEQAGRMVFDFGSRTLAESAEVTGTGTVEITFASGTPQLTNRGLWRPGASPGILTVDSDWPAPMPEAVLDLEIGGLTPGTEHDQLAVSGTAALGGTLRVTFTDGFTLGGDDRIVLVPAAAVTGAFDAIELPDGLEGYIDITEVGVELVAGSPVAGEDGPEVPLALALTAPAPNPAAGVVTLGYALPEAVTVRLVVFDALGREVAVLFDGHLPAGTHTARLDASRLAPGVYIARLGTEAGGLTRRLTVVR